MKKTLKQNFSFTKQRHVSKNNHPKISKKRVETLLEKSSLGGPQLKVAKGLDEDIDDDLAFDNNDELTYGSFFPAPSKNGDSSEQLNRSKTTGRLPPSTSANEDLEEVFSRIENEKRSGGISFRENGYESLQEIEISELLNEPEEDISRHRTMKKTNTSVKSSVKQPKSNKKSLDELRKYYSANEESLLESSRSFMSKDDALFAQTKTLKNLMQFGDYGSLKTSINDPAMILVPEVDETVKFKSDRRQTRETVAHDLSQYKEVLRQLREAPHIALPLPAHNSNPIPKNIGYLTSMAHRQLIESDIPFDSNSCFLTSSEKVNMRMKNDITARNSTVPQMARKMNELLCKSELTKDDISRGDNNSQENAHSQIFQKFPSSSNSSIGYITKLKSMLSAEVIRRKRLNRIKSKTYRRLLRKEKDRETENLHRAFALLHPEKARNQLAKKMEKARAMERATQKHKNTSNWVKNVKRYKVFDNSAHEAIQEQLSQHERLMAKMTEDAVNDQRHMLSESDVDSSDEESRCVDKLLTAVKSGCKDTKKLEDIVWKKESSGNSLGVNITPIEQARNELKNMKFMKNAREKQEELMFQELHDLCDDIKAGDKIQGSRLQKNTSKGEVNKESVGHFKFTPTSEMLSLRKSSSSLEKKVESSVTLAPEIELTNLIMLENSESQIDNEGLKRSASPREISSSSDPNSTESTKSTSRKRILPLNTEAVKSSIVSAKIPQIAPDQSYSPKLETQDYLISRAFSQDDVDDDDDFSKEKEMETKKIMPQKDHNASLPGWGEWGGVSKYLNKQHKRKTEEQEIKHSILKTNLLQSRADAGLSHVMINHDGVELIPNRMTLHMIPRPFSSPIEYTRSMRQPFGPEWNTALTFKDMTQPRIDISPGQAISPLSLTTHNVEKTSRRTKRKN